MKRADDPYHATQRRNLGLLLLLLVVQLPLVFNPGYLSFDELQWWARADVAWPALPWVAWTDVTVFQYRPLAFNLWLALAHAFAAHAFAMHAVFVLIGSANALLLAALLRRMGATAQTAAVAAIVFVMSPFVAYVHGWTGTLADLLVLGLGLAAMLALRSLDAGPGMPRPAGAATSTANAAGAGMSPAWVIIGVLLAQLLALMAKESAVVLPLALACAAIGSTRPRAVLGAAGGAALLVAGYLALRWPALTGAAAVQVQGGYAWSPANVPARLAEYTLFPWLPSLFEVGPALAKAGWRIGLAAMAALALVVVLGRSGLLRLGLAALLWAGLLAPVLVLGHAFNQYAYLASAALIGVAATAWSASSRPWRALLAAVAVLAMLHGAVVMARMREVGVMERRFHEGLVARVAAAPLARAFVVEPVRPADDWLLARWVDNVPAYAGTPLAGRVLRDAAGAPADAERLVMRADGTLESASAAAAAAAPAPAPAPAAR